jgi:hypothetical protein
MAARLSPPVFHVEAGDIAALNGDDLTRLLTRLLHAEAERHGVGSERVHTSLRTTDRDAGLDARVVEGTALSGWLGDGESAWQFKAGALPKRNKLVAEVGKPGVVEAIQRGATYVAVFGADPKPPTRQDRFNLLRSELDAIRDGAPLRLLCGSDIGLRQPMERKYPSQVLVGGVLDQQVVVIEVGRSTQGPKLTAGDGIWQ